MSSAPFLGLPSGSYFSPIFANSFRPASLGRLFQSHILPVFFRPASLGGYLRQFASQCEAAVAPFFDQLHGKVSDGAPCHAAAT